MHHLNLPERPKEPPPPPEQPPPPETKSSTPPPAMEPEPEPQPQPLPFPLPLPRPPPFKPIHYIPQAHKSSILSHPISQILIVTDPPSPENPTTNHWSFYLQTTSTSTPLIHLDCQPSHTAPSTVLKNGSKAHLIISELATDSAVPPAEAVRVRRIRAARWLRVENVVDAILVYGRFRYEFDENGVGCRMWVRDQLDLFLKERILVGRKEVEEVKRDILKLWPAGTESRIDEGAYYEVDE